MFKFRMLEDHKQHEFDMTSVKQRLSERDEVRLQH